MSRSDVVAASETADRLLGNPAYTMTQADFITRMYAPQPGEHHTFIGPNGCGKTTLALRLLAAARAQYPKTVGIVLVMKPHKGPASEGRKSTGDATVEKLNAELGGRVIRAWPPTPVARWGGEPTYWAVWPEHAFDPDTDDDKHHDVFRQVILDSYRRGDRWLFADEVLGLTKDLGLARVLTTVWTKSRTMKTALFGATQRPANVPQEMYSEAKHFFFWRMTDQRAYDRLGEIGGGTVEAYVIREILSRLPRHACLYLHPDTNTMAVLT